MPLETLQILPEWQHKIINVMGRFVLYDPETLQVFSISDAVQKLLMSPTPLSVSAEKNLQSTLQPFRDRALISSGARNPTAHSICNRSSVHAVLAVAADCNHRCSYCWNCYGRFGSKAGLFMDGETAKQVTEKLFSSSQESQSIEIEYYGGEPLIAWDAIVASVNRAEELAVTTPERN
jgi:sulfatase maturation enzyme AslB (radical SAM superfamily)